MLSCAAACLFLVSASPQSGDLFDQFDRNSDGRIDTAELPPVGGPIRSILQRRDANGDGVITRAEFGGAGRKPAVAPAANAEKKPQQSGNALFGLLDENKDGVVTRDEVPEAMRARVERIFQRVGKDRLTPSDLESPQPQTFFSLLDKNRDGLVTQAEIDAAASDPMGLRLSGLRTRPLFDAMRASKQTSFTEPELNALLLPVLRQQMLDQGLTETFRGLDVNGDGIATLAEAPPTLKAGLERMLRRLDQPLDVKLTFAEFERLARASQEALNTPAPPQRLTAVPAAFTVLDIDRSGTITPDELVDVIERLGRLDADRNEELSLAEFMGALPGQEVVAPEPAEPSPPRKPQISRARIAEAEVFVDRFFTRFDADKSGTLTAAEVPSFTERFSRFDANGDGALGRAEMIEAVLSAGK